MLALVLFIAREVWPQMFSFYSKNHNRQVEAKLETIKIEQQDEIKNANAERDARMAEREFRHKYEERQIAAYEKIVEISQTHANLLVAINGQLSQISVGQQTLTSFMIENIASMRERLAANAAKEQAEEKAKEKKVQ